MCAASSTSADVEGQFTSGGFNFIGALGQEPTHIYDVDLAGNTITVTDPFGLPQTPFDILVNDQVLSVTRVDGNVLHIDGSFFLTPPPEYPQDSGSPPWDPTGSEIRFDAFWNQDTVGTTDSALDPMLLAVDPVSGTHAPHRDSPLIDAGPVGEGKVQLTDQRGSVRYVDMDFGQSLPSDIGAYELIDKVSVKQVHQLKHEGQVGQTQSYAFEITRTDPSTELVVHYAASGSGTHPAGYDDFVGGRRPSGYVVFAPGELSQTAFVEVAGDDEYEHDEQFKLRITQTSYQLTIEYSSVEATILADEALVDLITLSVSQLTNSDDDQSGDVSLGDTLTYPISVTNAGTVPQRFIELSASNVSLDVSTCDYIKPGESCEFIGTYTVTQADVAAGSILVEAEAVSEYIIDPVTQSLVTEVAQDSSLNIQISDPSNTDNDGSGTVTVGDWLNFTITSTNNGTATQNEVQISANLGGGSPPCDVLAPGESCIETVTYQVTQSDQDVGSVTLSASVVSLLIASGVSDSRVVNVEPAPGSPGSSSSGDPGSSSSGDPGSSSSGDPGSSSSGDPGSSSSGDPGSSSSGDPDTSTGPTDGGSTTPEFPPPPVSGTGSGNDQIVIFYNGLGPGIHGITTCGEAYAVGSDKFACFPKDSPEDDDERNLDPPKKTPPDPTETDPVLWVPHENQTFPTRLPGPNVGNADVILDFQQGLAVKDYEVSYRGSLTFNPIASYSIPETVTLSGRFEIELRVLSPDGEWVDQYGSNFDYYQESNDDGVLDHEDLHFGVVENVKVNADNTITFTPVDAGTILKPREDANGNVYRYDTLRTVTAGLFVDFADESIPDVPIVQNVVSDVLIKNDLPVLRGDRMHLPDAASAMLYSEPIRVDLETTARIDLSDILFDPDGDPLRIEGFSDGMDKVIKSDRKFKLGAMESGDVHQPIDGMIGLMGDINPIANQRASDATWQEDDVRNLFATFSHSTIQLHNELTLDDASSSFSELTRWNPNAGSNVIMLDVLVAPYSYGTDLPVRVLQLEIHPVNESSSEEATSVNQPTQEWVSTVQLTPGPGGACAPMER